MMSIIVTVFYETCLGLSHTGLETSQELHGNLWQQGKNVYSPTGWQTVADCNQVKLVTKVQEPKWLF